MKEAPEIKKPVSNFRDIVSRFHIWVFIAAFAGGIIFSIITPIGQEADGAIHFYRAYDVSHGNLLLPFINRHDQSYLEVPANLDKYPVGAVAPDHANGYAVWERTGSRVMEWETDAFPDPREFPSIYYYPQAIGLGIGMLFSLTVFASVIIAHVLNALQYAVLVSLAVKYMPFYKMQTAVIALSPICIFQAASFSYDSLLNGLCFLVVALILHFAYGTDEELGLRQMLPVGIILAVIYMSKYVYVLLGLLVFLIPQERFKSKKAYVRTFAISLLPLVLYIAQRAVFATVLPSARMDTFMGVVKDTSGMTQLQFALAHPFEIIKVLLRTVYREFSNEIININILGWLTYTLEPLTYLLPVFWMGTFLLDKTGEPAKITVKTRIFAVAAAVLVWLGTAIGLYFFDPVANPAGYYYVQGLQGRYFVACLPLLAIACSPKRLSHDIKALDKKAVVVAFVFLVWAAWIFYKRCIGNGVFGWNGMQL